MILPAIEVLLYWRKGQPVHFLHLRWQTDLNEMDKKFNVVVVIDEGCNCDVF